jgi:hypothetical protein
MYAELGDEKRQAWMYVGLGEEKKKEKKEKNQNFSHVALIRRGYN